MHWPKRLTLLLFLLLPQLLLADAIMVSRAMKASTIAEVFIEQEAVRIELAIGIGDIPAFKNILPDDIYAKLGHAPAPLVLRLERFFSQDLVIEADGKPLRGGVLQMVPRKRLKRDETTGEPLPPQGDEEDILFAEFVYPFEVPPKTLSIKPPKDQEHGFVSTSIGIMTYHMGLPVMDFRYLSRQETIQLDWEDPWYSQFQNRNMRRLYNEPICAFLYAEPYETRIEIIVRPKDIQQWHDLGIQGLKKLPVDLQAELKERTATFLLTQMAVTIDGEEVEPQLQRINFLKRTLKSSTVIDPPAELDAISATLGIIYSVPTESLPQEATLTWDLFSPKMQTVRAAATDEAGPLPYKLTPDDNVLVWRNYLKNPTIPTVKPLAPPQLTKPVYLPLGTLLCLILVIPIARALHRKRGRRVAGLGAGILVTSALVLYPYLGFTLSVPAAPKLTDEASTELVSGLLGNVYTSFDFRDESTIYDALDQSLVGNLLTDVYLQTKKSLELASQGGARVKVKAVKLEQAEFEPLDNGFRATCTWDVAGSVGHWGHIHQRINRYRANLDIEPIEGAWKITALDVLEEERIK